jgi:hypothetical protein
MALTSYQKFLLEGVSHPLLSCLIGTCTHNVLLSVRLRENIRSANEEATTTGWQLATSKTLDHDDVKKGMYTTATTTLILRR